MADLKPKYPTNLHRGGHFDNDAVSSDPIVINRDEYLNEIPVDRPDHDENVPSVTGGFDRYCASDDGLDVLGGCNVIPYDANKVTPVAETVIIEAGRADRGRES